MAAAAAKQLQDRGHAYCSRTCREGRAPDSWEPFAVYGRRRKITLLRAVDHVTFQKILAG